MAGEAAVKGLSRHILTLRAAVFHGSPDSSHSLTFRAVIFHTIKNAVITTAVINAVITAPYYVHSSFRVFLRIGFRTRTINTGNTTIIMTSITIHKLHLPFITCVMPAVVLTYPVFAAYVIIVIMTLRLIQRAARVEALGIRLGITKPARTVRVCAAAAYTALAVSAAAEHFFQKLVYLIQHANLLTSGPRNGYRNHKAQRAACRQRKKPSPSFHGLDTSIQPPHTGCRR